jgi:hypothetical protein
MLPRRPALLIVALAAVLAVPASASAATTSAPPTIRTVKPLELNVGEKITLTGTGFIAGANKNTVVFKRDGKPALFVKAAKATATRLVVDVPVKLAPFLGSRGGVKVATRFRLRVLSRRFGARYTTDKLSPRISPPFAGTTVAADAAAAVAAAAPPDCDHDGIPDAVDPDDDNDLLTDDQEAWLGSNPCSADSDGDGVSDYFEYQSAVDLNGSYASKAPHPNLLVKDANIDFDQDGLTLGDEYQLWVYTTGGGTLPLTYSDGTQDTGNTGVTDDNRDADNDGLSNWDESHGRMRIGWWAGMYKSEKQYVGATGASPLDELSMTDPDSDGDGIPDGADDQDHDGVSNVDEITRSKVFPDLHTYWVHPYNPCLPNPDSRVCTLHPPMEGSWAPFDPQPMPAPDPVTHWLYWVP